MRQRRSVRRSGVLPGVSVTLLGFFVGDSGLESVLVGGVLDDLPASVGQEDGVNAAGFVAVAALLLAEVVPVVVLHLVTEVVLGRDLGKEGRSEIITEGALGGTHKLLVVVAAVPGAPKAGEGAFGGQVSVGWGRGEAVGRNGGVEESRRRCRDRGAISRWLQAGERRRQEGENNDHLEITRRKFVIGR